MRNLLVLLLLCLIGQAPAFSRQPKKPLQVIQLTVQAMVKANTADPVDQLYEFTVSCLNQGDQAYEIGNNMFYLVDDQGVSHPVDRVRNPTRATLAPGKSATFDRIYISIPRQRKPKELHLRGLGSCPLK